MEFICCWDCGLKTKILINGNIVEVSCKCSTSSEVKEISKSSKNIGSSEDIIIYI